MSANILLEIFMQLNYLGNTGLKVSRLCLGTLSMGPLQANLSIKEGTHLILEALKNGINFFDTAELYQTYPYLRSAIEKTKREKLVISTKSYAYDEETAKRSLDKALTEMHTDYIDIFSLHEQESPETLRGHLKALEYFYKMKEKGIIKALGLSTHHISAVLAGIQSPLIDVIHPIINYKGLGIQDGSISEMEEAVKKAYYAGKGIYAMKILGGGNLLNRSDECFNYILNFKYMHAAAVGMRTIDEIKVNTMIFENIPVPDTLKKSISETQRRLLIDFWCELCGECVRHCSHNALKISGGKVVVDTSKCVLCGYCGFWCPQFCIKIV